MLDLCWVIFKTVVDLFRPRAALGAEMLVLRQQIVVLRRGKPGRLPFSAVDKVLLGWVCHLFPRARGALAIVRPDTMVRWHRVRCYWRFKSRRSGSSRCAGRDPAINPRDEYCQSFVGCATQPRRTAEARHRCRITGFAWLSVAMAPSAFDVFAHQFECFVEIKPSSIHAGLADPIMTMGSRSLRCCSPSCRLGKQKRNKTKEHGGGPKMFTYLMPETGGAVKNHKHRFLTGWTFWSFVNA
jgi:hypothetical protein